MNFQMKDVEKEYEANSIKREDVEILKEWMVKQPHLPKITDLQITLFLHSCYNSIEAAKKTIDNYFTIRTLCPEYFQAMDIKSLQEHAPVIYIEILPEKTPEGYVVVISKLRDSNPDHYFFNQQVNFSDICFNLNLHQLGTRNGVVVIFDMEGLTLNYLTKFNLTTIKKHSFYVQEAFPVRIKSLHYINTVPFVDKILSMVKPFVKKDLFEMIHVHPKSNDTLYKFVPKNIMPRDYGGQAPSLEELYTIKMDNIMNNLEFFKWMDTLKVDESKRPGKPKNAGDIFGIDGTFKKLEID